MRGGDDAEIPTDVKKTEKCADKCMMDQDHEGQCQRMSMDKEAY